MLKKLFVLTAALFMTASLVSAQGANLQGIQVAPFKALHAGDVITAVSTDVGIYVRYVGGAAGTATVDVAAGGDLTFTDTGAATATFECPVAAPLGGVIDVSNAACDTIGEVLDIINAPGTGWIAVAAGMLRSDSSNDTLVTHAASDAKVVIGVPLLKDTVVALDITNVVLPGSDGGRELGIGNWMASPQAKGIVKNPFSDRATTLLYASENVTTGGAVGNFTVYCVHEDYEAGAETVQTLYFEAGAATTVTGIINEFVNAGGLTCTGGKMLVRIPATVNLTVPTVLSSGYVRREK